MPLSTYYLEYGRHVARLCRHRRRVSMPTSNTASHDNHGKINSWVFFSLLYEYGALLGGPLGCQSSANNIVTVKVSCKKFFSWYLVHEKNFLLLKLFKNFASI